VGGKRGVKKGRGGGGKKFEIWGDLGGRGKMNPILDGNGNKIKTRGGADARNAQKKKKGTQDEKPKTHTSKEKEGMAVPRKSSKEMGSCQEKGSKCEVKWG